MREKALKIRYRDSDHPSEKPIDYVYRKSLMLEYTFQGVDFGTIINYILERGGKGWRNILLVTPVRSLQEFKTRVKQHERQLLDESNDTRLLHDLLSRIKRIEGSKPRVNAMEISIEPEDMEIEVNAMTSRPKGKFKPRPKLPPVDPSEPQWITPSDDKTLTTRGFSPEQKALQPEFKGKKFRCRWCWSKKHWGKECKFGELGRKKLLEWHARKVKVNAITVEEEEESYSDEEPLEDTTLDSDTEDQNSEN
jgi:hypothetical protein